MKGSTVEKAILFRFPRERRAALLLAFFLALWGAAAYLILPSLWRRYEGAGATGGAALASRTAFGVPGDPINVAFAGSQDDIDCAFRAAGWNEAIKITWRSSLKIVESVILDRPDPDAPVSPLYYDGRPEDLAFEKAAGRSPDKRHHIRLWRTNSPVQSADVIWAAAATFDMGVGLSRYTFEVTHHINGNVDAERAYVVDQLRKIGAVQDEYLAAGSGPTLDGRNGGGDRYYTDGQIAVVTLANVCGTAAHAAPAPAPQRAQERRDAVWRALRPAR
ncbi:MAG: LssY C-terminal domain-containing protein [Hyphomicrobiales bacterium]|nr:LssY C-terminal domain-containing protein [Hyphomicrobiales bacterium]